MGARITVRLSEDLLRRAKRKAASESRTLTSLLEDWLRLVVSESRRSRNAKRSLPRISKAKGGPMSGIELTDTLLLQEAEDVAYGRRMLRAK
jgi:hypothetical protein